MFSLNRSVGHDLDTIVASNRAQRVKLRAPREEFTDDFAHSRRRCRRAVGCRAVWPRTPPKSRSRTASSPTARSRWKRRSSPTPGTPTKPVAQIRRDADAAFTKNDFRAGMALLGQIVAAAPNDSATWLRLARTDHANPPGRRQREASSCSNALRPRPTSPTSAPPSRARRPTASRFLGNVLSQRELWRPSLDALRLSLELREVADVRGQYERLREQHGFRVLDYSVDADTASPRACFQFSEDLPARTDFSPFVVLAGTDKPALSAAEKQLCVEGLQHGESYTVTLRAGSAVDGARDVVEVGGLFDLCARPQARGALLARRPMCCRAPASAAFRSSAPTRAAVAVEIYRIGDRSLVDAIGGDNYARGDFQRSLSRYEVEQLRESRAASRCGRASLPSSAAAQRRRHHRVSRSTRRSAISSPASTSWWRSRRRRRTSTTITIRWRRNGSSSPISASPRSPAMTASTSSSTRWRRTEAKNGVEVRLVSRSNEVLATRRTDASGHVQFEAGLASGEGGSAPAMLDRDRRPGRLRLP